MNEKQKSKYSKYIIFFTFFLIFLVFFFRSFLSFNPTDEAFYLSLTKKTFQGAHIFSMEGNPTQLYTFLLLPFLGLYYFVSNCYDGVYLAARLFYLTISFLVTIYFFFSIQKKKPLPALTIVLAVLFYFCFKRQNIEGLSYYSVYTTLLIISVLLYINKKYILSGLTIGFSVLCSPYTAIAVILFIITQFILKSKKAAILYILGVVISALVFITWLLGRQNLPETLYGFSIVLANIKHHAVSTPVERIKSWIYLIVINHKLQIFPAIIFVFFQFVWKFILKKENIDILTKLYMIFEIVILPLYTIKAFSTPGEGQLAITILGISFLFTIDRLEKEYITFTLTTIFSCIISLCWHFSSDTWDAYLIGFVLSCIFSVIFASIQTQQVFSPNQLTLSLYHFVITIILIASICGGVIHIYRDDNINKLDTRITEGPAAGLYTTSEHADSYNNTLNKIEQYEMIYNPGTKQTVYIYPNCQWAYMATKGRSAVYNSWSGELPSEDNIYASSPDYIYNLE